LLERSPLKRVTSTAGLIRASNPVRCPSSTLSIAPLMAPHAVWPKSSTAFAPATAHANSRLPIRRSVRSGDKSSGAVDSVWLSVVCANNAAADGHAHASIVPTTVRRENFMTLPTEQIARAPASREGRYRPARDRRRDAVRQWLPADRGVEPAADR